MINNYEPYSLPEIQTMLYEPWEVSDRPYKLHAAFAISCLFELLDPNQDFEDPEDYNENDIKNCWGQKISKNTLDRLVKNIAEDFNDAADNRKQIRIWDKNYSIRKVNAYDHKRLHLIFNFPLKDGEYEIVPEGILNLAGPVNEVLRKYEISKEQAQKNRNYLRQIIKLAEDDQNNGWDKLTNIEILIYCWAMFYNKYQSDNFKQFLQEYKDYVYVTESDIRCCLSEKCTLREKPIGMYAFSYDKVKEWNEKHNQKSFASEIPQKEAEDYWYDVALKDSFKPIDHQ